MRNTNIVRILVLISLSMMLAGCNDWTRTESVRFEYEVLENKNPQIYREYCERLKEYKSSDHALMIAKFENSTERALGESQHITSLPDSVDYVVLKNPDNLSNSMLAEMSEIRDVKGTRTLYEVSLPSIQAIYKSYLEQWAIDHLVPDTPEAAAADEETPEEFIPFMERELAGRISLYGKYDYDGIVIVYNGKNPGSLTEEKAAAEQTLQKAFFDPILKWRNANKEATLFFEGTPQYILLDEYRDLYMNADAIIAQTGEVAGYDSFDYQLSLLCKLENIPTDRFVVLVKPQSLIDPTLPDGKFSAPDENGNVKTTIIGAAEWTARPSDLYGKSGVCVDNAQNDYFNLKQDYLNIRRAITIMNPSF